MDIKFAEQKKKAQRHASGRRMEDGGLLGRGVGHLTWSSKQVEEEASRFVIIGPEDKRRERGDRTFNPGARQDPD